MDNLGFHYRDGWHFKRAENGDVLVHHQVGGMANGEVSHVLTIDDSSWASIVSSVSAGGETGERYRAALAFHSGRP